MIRASASTSPGSAAESVRSPAGEATRTTAASAPEEDEPDALMIVADEGGDYLTARAGKIEVIAENRLGVDFAVRITDRERAGLAGRRVADSDHRSVA